MLNINDEVYWIRRSVPYEGRIIQRVTKEEGNIDLDSFVRNYCKEEGITYSHDNIRYCKDGTSFLNKNGYYYLIEKDGRFFIPIPSAVKLQKRCPKCEELLMEGVKHICSDVGHKFNFSTTNNLSIQLRNHAIRKGCIVDSDGIKYLIISDSDGNSSFAKIRANGFLELSKPKSPCYVLNDSDLKLSYRILKSKGEVRYEE